MATQADWAPTKTHTVVMPNGKGEYSIVFDDDDNLEAHESVNNLAGNSAVDGPRGAGTVPPHTVDLVVLGQVNGTERRLEVLLHRGSVLTAASPLVTSGKIYLKGDVYVDGIKSITDTTQVTAGIHSNSVANQSDLILWESIAGDEAIISGDVTVQSSHGSSINMDGGAGTYTSGGESTGQSPQTIPSVNVANTVAANSSHPDFIPNSGSNTLTSGEYSYSGGVIHGDLVLDDSTLYVEGDLRVNGSISGKGSIYVNGETIFEGDTNIVTEEDRGLAILSSGNVTLKGFNGTQYLEDLAIADPDNFGVYFDDAKLALNQIQITINGEDLRDWTVTGNLKANMDSARRTLGQDHGVPYQGTENNTLGEMANYLDLHRAGEPSAEFLSAKLRTMRRFFDGRADANTSIGEATAQEILADFEAGTFQRSGVFDVLLDLPHLVADPEAISSFATALSYDRLGTSVFQGSLYSNGYIYAENEVEVIGGIFAEKNENSPTGFTNIGNVSLEPGDVYLTNGSSVIYNEEFMQGNSGGNGPLTVQTWLGR